jgi:hypothetical protein
MTKDVSATKILLLAANPKGMDKLRLDEEARDIKEGLRQAKERERFIIDSEWAVRPRDVRRAILYSRPNVVHFSGHGAEDGGLAFEDELGQVQLVQPEALSGLFKLLSEHVECVVLNACYSEIQSNAIAQYIDFVIGMKREIGDRAAIEFSVGFYDALGSGCSVEVAYEFGCNAIQMAGIEESLTPVLKKRGNLVSGNETSSYTESQNLSKTLTKTYKVRTATLTPVKIEYSFVLSGNIDEIDKRKLEAIVMHLREVTGDVTLTLLKVESGSIKLTFEGSEEGFKSLKSLVLSGELSQVQDFPVQEIRQEANYGAKVEINQLPPLFPWETTGFTYHQDSSTATNDSSRGMVTLYLPADLHRQLKARAAIDSEPMAEIAQKALKYYLSHTESSETNIKTAIETSNDGEDATDVQYKALTPEIQIQRLTAQLTRAYNRMAALEEQIISKRISESG